MSKRPAARDSKRGRARRELASPEPPGKRLCGQPRVANSYPGHVGALSVLGACPPCAQRPAAQARRPKNRLACDGRGGCPVGAGCKAVFTQLFNLRQHKHQDSRTCGVCGKACTMANNFYKHFRKAHPQRLDAQGGCAAHGDAAEAPSPQTLPEAPWKARLDAVDARHGLAPGTMWGR